MTLPAAVEQSLRGGVTCIQLREKQLSDEELFEDAKQIQKLCKQYCAPFIVNDRVKLAMQLDADGVHVGQSDMDAHAVRKKIGPDKILGVSAQNVDQALKAQASGADYLGVGAMFPTKSKDDACAVSLQTLSEICAAVNIPVVAIGGININNVNELAGSGIAGVALISALYAQENIENATKEMRDELRKYFTCNIWV